MQAHAHARTAAMSPNSMDFSQRGARDGHFHGAGLLVTE